MKTPIRTLVTLLALAPCAWAQPGFVRQTVDAAMAGDCKMVGDIDGDGFADVAVAGMPTGEPLTWYRWPDWHKTVIAQAQMEWSNYGVLADVDLDGDADIVLPDGIGPTLHWFENPGGTLALVGSNWTKRTIGNTPEWCKDVFVADYDGDGRPDVSARPYNRQPRLFFREGNGTWTSVDLAGFEVGSEGMWSADVDGDGDEDLVTRGQIARNPGGVAARNPSNWSVISLGSAPADFKAFVADLDGDGKRDVLFSSSEGLDAVVWFQQPADGPGGIWTRHTLLASADAAHTLWAADFDADGDQDVLVGAMNSRELILLENNGGALSWTPHVLDANAGIHNGQVVDFEGDGDPDIFGAGFTGQATKATVWINQTNPTLPLDSWTYFQLSDQHAQAFGLDIGDLDGDAFPDLVSGNAWYRNPGPGLGADWTRTPLPAGMQAVLVANVDNDTRPDILACRDEGVNTAWYWLEPSNAAATTFSSVQIATLPAASHALGAQGHRLVQIVPGGKPEILTTSGNGAWYITIPASNPAAGNWPSVRIHANPSDEGLDAADLNGDGFPDVVATTGDSKRVEWYQNPGNGTANWTARVLGGVPEFVYPDRCRIGDLNGDGRPDVVVTEENGAASGALTCWWEHPAAGPTGTWTRHTLVSQGSTHALDLVDLDRDGDLDILLGEHKGGLKTAVWENQGGGTFVERIVSSGKETHAGLRAVDLDGDGDRDLVGIAWDASATIHLWRNDGTPAAGDDSTPPELLSVSAVGPNEVLAVFSERLDETKARDPQRFGIAGVFVGSATPEGAGTRVRLLTSTLPAGAALTLGVDGLDDLADPPNATLPGESMAFSGPLDPDSGLLHHWSCDEGGGATLGDSAGTWPGTLVSAGWDASGRSGSALSFAGNGRATLGSANTGANALTLALWFRPAAFGAGVDARFLSKASSTSEQGHHWMLGLTESGGSQFLRARLRTGGSTTTLIASGSPVVAGTWRHAALVYDGSTLKLYLDTTEVASVAKTGALDEGSGVPMSIGSQPDGSNGFNGLLDDIRIYNRALSPSELASLVTPAPSLAQRFNTWALGLAHPAPDDDNDDDGVPNLIEFLGGGNASLPDAADLTPSLWRAPDGTRIGLRFRNAQSGVPLRTEISFDLDDWFPLPSFPDFDDVDGGPSDGQPTRIHSLPLSPAGPWFLRLRVGY